MKTFNIPVKETLIAYLSGINRDVVGRKMVLKKILSSSNNNMNSQLEMYEKEYLEKYGEYEVAKSGILEKIISESEQDIEYDKIRTDANWSIDFYNKILEIKILNNNHLEPMGKVDTDIIDDLRIRSITVAAMQELISEYVSDGYDVTSPTYKKYFEKFIIENEAYELKKQEVAKKYGVHDKPWKIDFESERIYQIL